MNDNVITRALITNTKKCDVLVHLLASLTWNGPQFLTSITRKRASLTKQTLRVPYQVYATIIAFRKYLCPDPPTFTHFLPKVTFLFSRWSSTISPKPGVHTTCISTTSISKNYGGGRGSQRRLNWVGVLNQWEGCTGKSWLS